VSHRGGEKLLGDSLTAIDRHEESRVENHRS
jgi:hypothetical protein